jgi:hypothetical protein
LRHLHKALQQLELEAGALVLVEAWVQLQVQVAEVLVAEQVVQA